MDNLSAEEMQLRANQVTDEVKVLLGISHSFSFSFHSGSMGGPS